MRRYNEAGTRPRAIRTGRKPRYQKIAAASFVDPRRALARITARIIVCIKAHVRFRTPSQTTPYNRPRIRGSLSFAPVSCRPADSYFPGRQDLETKWVKCATRRELQGGEDEGEYSCRRVSVGTDFPWAAIVLYVMVNVRRPLSCE